MPSFDLSWMRFQRMFSTRSRSMVSSLSGSKADLSFSRLFSLLFGCFDLYSCLSCRLRRPFPSSSDLLLRILRLVFVAGEGVWRKLAKCLIDDADFASAR